VNLTGTTQSLELSTDAGDVDWTTSYADIDKSGATAFTPGSNADKISGGGTATIVAAPGAATTYRTITGVTVRNTTATPVVATVQKDVAGNNRTVIAASLAQGEALIYEDGAGWDVYNANGKRQTQGADGADGAAGAPGAAGVGTTGTATLDFGGFPGASDASVAVTGQAGIVAGSVVEAWLRLEATGDHSADEHLLETLKVTAGNVVAGVGFTVYGVNTNQVLEQDPSALGMDRYVGPGIGANAVRPERGGGGTRIYGQWSVNWRWS
jgi:hypothetical protein